MTGPLWRRMLHAPRHAASALRAGDVPIGPGVYVWFRDDEPVYAGRPAELTEAQVARVTAWIRTCEVAWATFNTVKEAKDFEKALLAEWMPPLSRR